jgi:histidinol-phosphatase (PHP family)
MGLVDYHIHTTRCRHALGTMEEYVRNALASGLDEIGFADHLPLPGPEGAPFNMPREELPDYVAEVEALRLRYPEIPIRLGIEADFLPENTEGVRELLALAPFDYVIGSVHYLEATPGDVRLLSLSRFWEFLDETEAAATRREVERVVQDYHARLRASAESGLFHVIGHCDLTKRFGYRLPGDPLPEYRKTAEAFARAGVLVELNTSGLRSPAGEIYPGLDFLRVLCEAGVGITLASDAHHPGHVGFGLALACDWARRAGYDAIHAWAAPGRFAPRPLP